MQIICNEQHALHRGRMEMFRGELVPSFEKPERVELVLAELRRRGCHALAGPDAGFDQALLRAIHAPHYLEFLAGAWDAWVALDPANATRDVLPSYWPAPGMRRDVMPLSFPARVGLYAFDAGSPLMAGTWEAARHGAACAWTAARRVAAGERTAFALTRPPGHHAGADFYGGYCFLNNAALAAQTLRDAGAARVAVLDVDYHHGNGTQAIFYARSDVHVASLHGNPLTDYPYYLGHADERGEGAGLGFNHNLPLARGTAFEAWRAALREALAGIAAARAEALVVSLGVDTFEADPVAGFSLVAEDFLRAGEEIAAAGLPTVFVFEGGYAVAQLGVNVANVLDGFAQIAA
ncbi:histone deacetylase family protein [Variovorax sp.]|uniref:histone deacetylase family protein n=1 Tax=Variovorax sp. TaxID=1871043 RepID=UPI002D286B41|nr:histone deacetylase family protein [Variovorax sp.]HYP83253.1 histone deacetylase family protein [Variovorax sp.]